MVKRLLLFAICIFTIQLFCLAQNETNRVNSTKKSQNIQHHFQNNEDLLDSLKSLMDSYRTNYYKINISFLGYETSSEQSYYFDKLGAICGCYIQWDMEGQSGQTYYWFKDENLKYYYEETNGIDGDLDTTFLKTPVDFKKLQTHESDFKTLKQSIFNNINENKDSLFETESSVNLTIDENLADIYEFTQTTEVVIDKELYLILFKND